MTSFSSTGRPRLAPPRNVTLFSQNFTVYLTWLPGLGSPPNVTYFVTYQRYRGASVLVGGEREEWVGRGRSGWGDEEWVGRRGVGGEMEEWVKMEERPWAICFPCGQHPEVLWVTERGLWRVLARRGSFFLTHFTP
jgi:hypothetical protein